MNEELANRLDGSLGFAVSYIKRIPKPVDEDQGISMIDPGS